MRLKFFLFVICWSLFNPISAKNLENPNACASGEILIKNHCNARIYISGRFEDGYPFPAEGAIEIARYGSYSIGLPGDELCHKVIKVLRLKTRDDYLPEYVIHNGSVKPGMIEVFQYEDEDARDGACFTREHN